MKKAIKIVFTLAALCLMFSACSDSNSKAGGSGADKKALLSAITSANSLLNTVNASDADGSGLQIGAKYAPSASWDSFKSVIDASEIVYADKWAEQNEVDEYAAGLEAAINIFERAVNTVGGQANNKPQLDNAVKTAEYMIESLIDDYTDNTGTLASGARYVSTAEWNGFNNVINTAKAVYQNPTATPTQVNTAITSLANAGDLFKAAIKVKTPISSFREDEKLVYTPSLNINADWGDDWGTGFKLWVEPNILSLPDDGYFRVEFENVGSDWPVTVNVLGYDRTFAEDFLVLICKFGQGEDQIPTPGIELVGLGPVAGGHGEAFIAIKPIKDFMNDNKDANLKVTPPNPGQQVWLFLLSYGHYHWAAPGNEPHNTLGSGYPTFVTSGGAYPTLTLEVWLPE